MLYGQIAGRIVAPGSDSGNRALFQPGDDLDRTADPIQRNGKLLKLFSFGSPQGGRGIKGHYPLAARFGQKAAQAGGQTGALACPFGNRHTGVFQNRAGGFEPRSDAVVDAAAGVQQQNPAGRPVCKQGLR